MSRPDNTSIHRIPFVRLLLPFLAGIMAGLAPVPYAGFLLGFIMFVGAGMALYAFAVRDPSVRYRRESLGGAGILLMFLAAGGLAALPARRETAAMTSLTGPAIIRGYVLQPPGGRSESEKVLAGVQAVRQEGKWYKVKGKAVLYFGKDSEIITARPGDMLLVRTTLHNFPFYNNPGEFDYRRYMNNRGFFWEGFVKRGAWCRMPGQEKGGLKVLAARVRASLVRLLKDYGFSGQRLAVAAALLAGEREYLDRETRSLFSASGTMHILAISGLHVGIIYVVLMWLLRPAARVTALRYLRYAIILIALWGYAFLTGLTPSVTRAALMFSLFLTADLFRRRNNPFNTLAVAAFLMLLIHPPLVRDAAFQLSYMAVLGILAFYRPFSRPLLTGLPVIDKAGSLVAVSLAAQTATFPLILYYFHRLSLLSPLTNVLVIPLLTFFIYGGLLFFLLHSLSWVAMPLTLVLHKTAGLLLQITARAGTVPHVLTGPVWLSTGEVLWFYLLLLCIILLVRYRNVLVLISLQVVVLLGAGYVLMREVQIHRTARLLVFNIPGRTAALLSYGTQGVLVTDDPEKTDYYTRNAGEYFGLKQMVTIPASCLMSRGDDPATEHLPGFLLRDGFLAVGSVSAYMLTDSTYRIFRDKISVDEMIFSGKKWWLVKKQLATLETDRILLTPAVSRYAAGRIRESCPGKRIVEIKRSGPCLLEEKNRKIMHKSFPLLCNFYTFASYLHQNQRPSRKIP